MESTKAKLLMIRIKSLAWELATTAGVALVGFILSPEFIDPLLNIIKANAGESALVVIAPLIIMNVVKHLRNKWAVHKAENNLGASEDQDIVLL